MLATLRTIWDATQCVLLLVACAGRFPALAVGGAPKADEQFQATLKLITIGLYSPLAGICGLRAGDGAGPTLIRHRRPWESRA
jgi:hypothetical protein